MDFSQFSDSDLKALAKGDYAKVSDAGLAAHAQIEAARQQATQQAGPQAFKPAENIDKAKLESGAINGDPQSRAPDVNKQAIKNAGFWQTMTSKQSWDKASHESTKAWDDVVKPENSADFARLGAAGMNVPVAPAMNMVKSGAKSIGDLIGKGAQTVKDYGPGIAAATYAGDKIKKFFSGE